MSCLYWWQLVLHGFWCSLPTLHLSNAFIFKEIWPRGKDRHCSYNCGQNACEIEKVKGANKPVCLSRNQPKPSPKPHRKLTKSHPTKHTKTQVAAAHISSFYRMLPVPKAFPSRINAVMDELPEKATVQKLDDLRGGADGMEMWGHSYSFILFYFPTGRWTEVSMFQNCFVCAILGLQGVLGDWSIVSTLDQSKVVEQDYQFVELGIGWRHIYISSACSAPFNQFSKKLRKGYFPAASSLLVRP